MGDRQLERYLEELAGKTAIKSKALVILSRYPIEIPADVENAVIPRRWYQVADRLREELATGTLRSPVSMHIVEQFAQFMTERGITMEPIRWELVDGVKSFRGLIDMVMEAAAALKVPTQKSAAWDSMGFYLHARKFWVGVFYERPGALVFTTMLLPIGEDAVEKAGSGKVQPESYAPARIKWVDELVLDSEEVHFFARSCASQLQRIEKFLTDSIAAAQRACVVSDQQ